MPENNMYEIAFSVECSGWESVAIEKEISKLLDSYGFTHSTIVNNLVEED